MSTDLRKLVEKAGKTIGSEYKLAKMLGVPQSLVSAWKSGDKPCSPADRVRLAGVANEDAIQELVRATIDSAKGELRRQQLRELLGKLLRPTGGVVHSLVLMATSLTFGMMTLDLPRCIKRRMT